MVIQLICRVQISFFMCAKKCMPYHVWCLLHRIQSRVKVKQFCLHFHPIFIQFFFQPLTSQYIKLLSFTFSILQLLAPFDRNVKVSSKMRPTLNFGVVKLIFLKNVFFTCIWKTTNAWNMAYLTPKSCIFFQAHSYHTESILAKRKGNLFIYLWNLFKIRKIEFESYFCKPTA